MTEASLSAKVTADITDFTKKFDDLRGSIDKLGSGVTAPAAGLAQTAGAVERLSGQAKFTATALTGVASAVEGTFFGIAKTMSASTEQVAQIAQQTGISASALEGWQPILARTNTSVQSFATSYRALSKDIVAAQEGNQAAIDKFSAMGLSVEQLGSTSQVIEAIADRMASMTGPAARAQLAVDLLGRSGLQLIPALSEGSQGLRASAAEAQAFGQVLSEVQRNQLLQFDDSLDTLGSAFQGFKTQVALAVTPALQAVADMVTGAIGWFNRLDDGVKQVVSVFGTAFTAGVSLVPAAAAAAAGLGFALTPILAGGATIVALIAAVTLIIANWQKIKDTGSAIWTGVRDTVVGTARAIYEGIVEWLVTKASAVAAKVQRLAQSFAKPFEWLADHLVGHSVVPDMVAAIESNMNQLPSKMIPQARRAVTEVKNIFRELEAGGAGGNIGAQIQSLDLSRSSGSRAAVSQTVRTIETGKFTFIDAQNEMASVATQTWGSITNTVGTAFAQQVISGNNWAQTLRGLGTMVLGNFVNMILQMGTQWLVSETTRTAATATANGTIVASNTVAATASTSIWAGASSAILGFFGSVTAGFTAMAGGLVTALTAVGAFVMGVLGAIAEALTATVFGIPYAGAILLGVAAIAGALAATGNLGFRDGGIGDFGAGTPATLHGKEAIIPLNQRGADFMQKAVGAGGGLGRSPIIRVPVYLNGRQIALASNEEAISALRQIGVPV